MGIETISEKKVFQPKEIFIISYFSTLIVVCFFTFVMFFWLGFILSPLILFFGTIYCYLKIKSTFIELKDTGIEIRAGVFFKSQSTFLYSKIQDIEENQSLVDRILNLKSLSVKTMTVGSAIGGVIPGLDVKDADYVREYVLGKLNKSFVSSASENKDSFALNVVADKSADSLQRNIWAPHYYRTLIFHFLWMGLFFAVALVSFLIEPTIGFFIGMFFVFSLFSLPFIVLKPFIQSISFSYYVGKTRIEFVRKFISVEKNVVPVFKVQDIVILRPFFEKILGLSTVNIETGELEIKVSSDSKKDYYQYGNMVPFLFHKDALEFRKYVYDLLKYDQLQVQPSLVEEHPLSNKKVIKKFVLSMFGWTIGFAIISIFGWFLFTGYFSESLSKFVPFNSSVYFVLVLLAYVALVIFVFIYELSYVKSYYYNISKNLIYIRKGVFGQDEIALPFKKVQNIFVDQDIFDRFFGLYDVHFSTVTTTSANLCHIDGLTKEDAEAVKEILLTLFSSNNKKSNF